MNKRRYKLWKLIMFLSMATIRICAQESEGVFLTDRTTGCKVWCKHALSCDSVSWNGECSNGLASGKGTMTGFKKGEQVSEYLGEMRNGNPNGKGVFTYGTERKLAGNFSDGEPLFLKDELLKRLYKNIISEVDNNNMYKGDNNKTQLYYHALIPEGKINGCIVLMPGTQETTEHLISSTSKLFELGYSNHLAILALSINQRLTLNNEVLKLMNDMIGDALTRYAIPENKVVIGGWSMGGLFSLRYTELANQDVRMTRVKPVAVFSCDGPTDLVNIYNMFQMKLKKFPDNSEAIYGINELGKYCGGSPGIAKEKYIYYSSYTHADDEGGNAKYLLNTPVRIYNDLDVNWWMENRGLDMYYMNGLDQSAMIQFLNDKGNAKATFINAFGKGFRLEGNRHPHSWSIVEPDDLINWVLKYISK